MIFFKFLLLGAFLFVGVPFIWATSLALFAPMGAAGFLIGMIVAFAVMMYVGAMLISF